MTITLVVADDHPIVRGGLVSLLDAEDDITVVAAVGTGAEAVMAVLEHRPSAVIMDLRMPEMGGVEATEAIRAEIPDAVVIVLTTYDTDDAIIRAVEAGATGYMLKDTDPDTLVGGIRRAVQGETVLAPPVAKRLVDRIRDPEAGALSSRELDVLQQVALGRTNAMIAQQLHISQATVKTHLLHIYDKLGVSDRAAAVARAYESGLLSI